jgi:hypothetical protein
MNCNYDADISKYQGTEDYVRFAMSWKMNFFFFECKRNTNNRNILYQYFQNIYSNFLELNDEEKLRKILNPSTLEQIRTVTSFIRQALELREEIHHRVKK